MQEDKKWMKLALKEAQKAKEKDEVPIGAIIVCDGKVIARAHNLKETSKRSISHAEILVIEKANKKTKDWRLNNCTLYVTIEPCVMCCGAIIQSRIKRVVYGACDKKFGGIQSNLEIFKQPNWNHYPEITSGILAEESAAIIKEFFQKKRNKK